MKTFKRDKKNLSWLCVLSYIPAKKIYIPVAILFFLRSTWNLTLGPVVLTHVFSIPSIARPASVLPLGTCHTRPSVAMLSMIKINTSQIYVFTWKWNKNMSIDIRTRMNVFISSGPEGSMWASPFLHFHSQFYSAIIWRPSS